MMIPRSLGTHDGSFHADEVTACSLLLLFDRIDRDKILRTRDLKALENCDYVCDVGGVYDPRRRRFDHHQLDYTGTMSSAGMVLLHLKDCGIIEEHLCDFYNKTLVWGVDAHDNGKAKLEMGTATFSQIISNFMPIEYDVDPEEMNRAFFQAVDFTIGHLDRLKQRHFYTLQCSSIVKKAMERAEALVFEESLPWMENFFSLGGEVHPAQFVVMPSGSHWKLRGIPPNLQDRMSVRKPLPAAWAGLRDQELEAASGIKGGIFCHKGRFISVWQTREAAMQALHIALKKG